MVRVVGKGTLPEDGTKMHDAPLGSGPVHAAKSRGPPQGRESWARVIVMVLEPDAPATTVMSPDVDTMTVQDPC